MKRKSIIAGIVVIVIIAVVVGVILGTGGGGDDDESTVSGDGQVIIPINLEGADNVGSISIELSYDSGVLKATGVETGDLASNSMLESNISNSGQVIIGIIDSAGINGDGAVTEIDFDVIDSDGTSPLTLSAVETHDAITLIDIINETSDGSFIAEDGLAEAPLITFNQ